MSDTPGPASRDAREAPVRPERSGEERTPGYRPRRDQFVGCIVGQCLGDALGFAVEGQPPAVCAHYAEVDLDPDHPALRKRPPFLFGQYTDDSQLARELLLSLVERRGLDPADYAARIMLQFTGNRVVGPGRATTEAALRLAGGVAWTESGTPAPSAGNGSAMRAAPIGLFYWDRPAERMRAAHDQGRITHADPRCSAGAAAIAGAVALALRPGSLDPDEFLLRLAPEVETFDAAFGDYLHRLRGWVALPPDEAAAPIARAGLEPEPDEGWEGISPFVVGSVLWSLYSFLRSPDDYWTAIRIAIAVGGDADTTAAMTGAISGARLGLDAVPLDLALRLTDRGSWHLEKLAQIAERCHEIAVGGGA
jgi:ADP-ribosylglycohydrolase